MKIAIDIRTAGGEKAGKGWYTFHLVRNLLQLDQENEQTTAGVPTQENQSASKHFNEYILYSKDGIAGFEEFPNARLKLLPGRSFLWHYNVASDLKKEKVDVFFAPSSYIIPALLPKSIKSIVTVHDLVAFLFPSSHNKKATIIEKIFLKRALKKASKILTISKNTKEDIIARFKNTENKIEVISCAADSQFRPSEKEHLTAFAKQTNLPKHFFLAVGTLEPRKNYPTLLRAFAKVQDFYPDYNLLIVGGKGWGFEEIYKEIAHHNLTSKVHLLGYLSNSSLVKLYNLARALVFPSFYEGFGIPPLEAMQSGCPVIASYSSSIPEVVGDSAILINPQSETEIAGAMINLIRSEDLVQKLRNLGLIQSKKFSWKGSAGKLLELIKSF